MARARSDRSRRQPLPVFSPPPEMPPESIIINLEQVGSEWFDEQYLALLSRYRVLDYNRGNLEKLHRAGIRHARLLEIGYSPNLTRIERHPQQPVDVAFFGALSERRVAILYDIDSRGLIVVGRGGIYGVERDAILARSKIALNIHYAEQSPFEIIRVSHLLANRLCVVTEGSQDDPDLAWLADGLIVASAEDIPDICAELAADEARRLRLALRGFELISSRRQSDLLKAALSSH